MYENPGIYEKDTFLDSVVDTVDESTFKIYSTFHHTRILLFPPECKWRIRIVRYKTNERDILEQLEVERKREKDLKDLKKIRGALFTNIRGALQSISTMLLNVKQTGRAAKKVAKNGNKNILKEVDEKEDTEERDVLPELEEMDTDGNYNCQIDNQ